jgi:hypothetical protein
MSLDLDITPELLVTMYNKQYKLQCYMHEKRRLTIPPVLDADSIDHEHVLAAIYFFSCMNIEWAELQEVYNRYLDADSEEDKDLLREEALLELIDVFHFALTVFIFLGLKEDLVSKLVHFKLGALNSFAETVGSSVSAISEILQILPYKTWKDAAHIQVIDSDYRKILLSKLGIVYNNILDFALYNLDSSYEEFIKAYLQKNALNFKRQEDKSLGYIN